MFDATRLTEEAMEWVTIQRYASPAAWMQGQYVAAVRIGKGLLSDDSLTDDDIKTRIRYVLAADQVYGPENKAVKAARYAFYGEVIDQAWVVIESTRAEVLREIEAAESARLAAEQQSKADAKRAMIRAKMAVI